MSLRDEVRPKWVLVNGKLRDVSEFAHVQPRMRPVSSCPVCQRNVILKLAIVIVVLKPGDGEFLQSI